MKGVCWLVCAENENLGAFVLVPNMCQRGETVVNRKVGTMEFNQVRFEV